MNMQHLARFLALAGLAVALNAQAAIVYDNGTPNTANGYPIGGTPYSTADDFVLGASGNVASVGFYFQNYNGITGWDQQISYNIRANSGGTPGAILASGAGQNVTPTLSVYPWCCGGGNAWLVEFNLQAAFAATAGTTYWLELTGAGGPSPWWVTTTNNASPDGVYMSGDNGSSTGNDFAFYLSDNGVGAPAPGSLALIGLGLLGFGVLRRRLGQAARPF